MNITRNIRRKSEPLDMAELESAPVRAYIVRRNKDRRLRARTPGVMPLGAYYDWDAETIPTSQTVNDGDSIGQWFDSIIANEAAQLDINHQPRIRIAHLNGKSYVEFFELSFMDVAFPIPDTHGTFIFVFSTAQEQAGIIVCNGIALYACVDNLNNFRAYTDQQLPDSGFTLNIGGWHAMAVRFTDNGSADFYLGGVKHSFSGANLGYIDRGGTALGSEPLGGGNFLHGGIARLAFYNSLLSDADIFSGLDYLETFYSI